MQTQVYISNRQFPGSKEQLLKAMLEAFSEMVYLYDALENRFVFISDNLTEKLGYSGSHIFDGNGDVNSLIHPDDLPQIVAATISLFKKRDAGAVKCSVRIKHANGQYRWFSIRQVIFSHSLTGERVQYIFGIAVDIHDRKKAEARILAQNQAISDYVFATSHTVRAPLSNILAIARLFDELPEDDIEELREWAKTMKEQAEKLDMVIQQIVRKMSPETAG
jgi:PAS domain S-box-containing protein